MAQAQIVIAGVSHCYRPPSGRPVLALEDVTLDVRGREFVALLGPSGCGKSTLLYLIGGFLPTETGKILIEGKPFGALDAQTRGLMQSELLSIWQRTPKTVIFVTHDVQEAVYLADRVAVMSARPGRIKTIVDTKFDKSDPAIFKNQGFIDKVDEIWNLVRIEAIKAQGGRRE